MFNINEKTFNKSVEKHWLQAGTKFKKELYEKFMHFSDRYNVIVGYGSLLNEQSARSSFKNAQDLGFDYLENYERVFSMGGVNTGFLNVRRSYGDTIVVRRWSLNRQEFASYIIREGLYNLVKTPLGITCIAAPWINPNITPNLNYWRTCLADLDAEGKLNFKNTTYNIDNQLTVDYIKSLYS